MKKCLKTGRFFEVMGWVLMILFGAHEVLAADKANNWRLKYNLILMWVNFGILAFIIVKFARTPLKEFIFGQRKNLIRELEQKEA